MHRIGLYLFCQNSPLSVSERIARAMELFDPSFPLAGQKIKKTPRGKPEFKQEGAFLSISHSGKYWLLGLAHIPLGVDVQQPRPARFEAIARRFFHPEETAYLASTAYREFYTIWTQKESYVKLTGTGIDSGFRHFSVFQLPVHFSTLTLPDGYVISACSTTSHQPILKLF